jgi:hypothetical protein
VRYTAGASTSSTLWWLGHGDCEASRAFRDSVEAIRRLISRRSAGCEGTSAPRRRRLTARATHLLSCLCAVFQSKESQFSCSRLLPRENSRDLYSQYKVGHRIICNGLPNFREPER